MDVVLDRQDPGVDTSCRAWGGGDRGTCRGSTGTTSESSGERGETATRMHTTPTSRNTSNRRCGDNDGSRDTGWRRY